MTFITFEGIDGTGKTTVAERIAKKLGFKLTFEPTEGPLGRELGASHIRGDGAVVEALLFVADRVLHTEELRKWLENGENVISDRYFHSTIAYQLAAIEDEQTSKRGEWDEEKKKEWREWLIELNRPIVLKPDITILFDIDVDTALDRVGKRGGRSRFEQKEYLKRVRENYLELARDPRWNIDIIKADGSQEEVTESVMAALESNGIP